MYDWQYIVDCSLAKLDLTEQEANVQNLINRFPYYANEAMTQICSSVKPKFTFAEFVITSDKVGKTQVMPDDFVSFGDDVSYELLEFCDKLGRVDLSDDEYVYNGTNEIVFCKPGHFYISYNARWYTFKTDIDTDDKITAPDDVLDCIPSYIVSQCYKIDDEYKATVFRNEYEIMLSRLDNTNYKKNDTIKIGGGW